ncbi:conserved membrane hypothetical protein [Candidatus Nitrotoga sp. M5]|nr:conserved membrane hypothetical protein [Candidatus Nitrotoga sp. M5]
MKLGIEAIGGTVAAFIIPPITSLIFKLGNLGSIGPTVFFYSILCLLLLIILYYKFLATRFSNVVAIPIAAAGGTVMAVLILNYFMLVTFLFGIKDFHAM